MQTRSNFHLEKGPAAGPDATTLLQTGAAAVDYFTHTLPGASASDTARSDNEAEWIVNLITRVRA